MPKLEVISFLSEPITMLLGSGLAILVIGHSGRGRRDKKIESL